METAVSVLRVVHIVTAVLMAWPFYALVTVNNRARLGPPLGDRVDVYMETMIKNRTVPCYVFQATALISGIVLILLRGAGLGVLATNLVLGTKFVLLQLIGALLTYIFLVVQPAIDRLFAGAGSPVPKEVAVQIQAWRLRRKRIASLCLFSVLTAAMLGVQVWAAFPGWLTLVLLAAIAGFSWRAYSSITPYGWA